MYKTRPETGLPVPSLATRPLGELRSRRGVANGYAPLGADGKVPIAFLPALISSPWIPKGDWNATTNTPTIPAAAAGNVGWIYVVSVAGTTNIDGQAVWAIGDQLISDGVTWSKIPYPDVTAYTATGGSTPRTDRQRWGDTVYAMDHGLDPSGVSITAHTALNDAVAEAIARNYSEIRLPPGNPKLGAATPVQITVPTGKKIRIIGAEKGTRIKKDGGTGVWFKIGIDGGVLTEDVILENLVFEPGDPMTGDCIIDIRNAKGTKLRGIQFKGVRTAIALGQAAGAPANDVVYTDIEDCSIWDNGLTEPMIRLGSGAVLNIRGGDRSNGTIATGSGIAGRGGCSYIVQDHAVRNFDGLFVYDHMVEGFKKYIDVTGQGIVEMTWKGGQMDHFTVGFDTSNMPASGVCEDWSIIGVKMLFGDFPIVWSKGTGTAARGLTYALNNHKYCAQYVALNIGTYANVLGNTFQDSGFTGGMHIAAAFAGGQIANNTSERFAAGTQPVHGITWTNGPLTARDSSNNKWNDVSGTAETGTK